MPGFLDPSAPSATAEYARYIDGDLLGKLITKNLLINRLGYTADAVFTPLGRYGDAKVKHAIPGIVAQDAGDGHVTTDVGTVTFEIKCARINVANRYLGFSATNWAFVNLITTPGKAPKTYDLLIAVGIEVLGLEDERYWSYLKKVHDRLRAAGHSSNIEAMPHESDFLSICSFFILPRTRVPTNYFRVNVDAVQASKYAQYRAHGYDETRCKAVWNDALRDLRRA